MDTNNGRIVPGRRRRTAVMAALAVAGGALLGACGSSGHASAVGTPLQQACAAVTAVLGNGPDPGADPVGYAAAQPIQLRTVPTSDSALRSGIDELAAAYQRFATTNGSAASETAVKAASAKVDAVCPGATS